MPVVKCPLSGCTYETPAGVSDRMVCILLDLHKLDHQPGRPESSLDHNSSEMLELTPNSDFESVFTKEGYGCHRVNLDEPRSESSWSAVVDHAKSRKMRLNIIAMGADGSDSDRVLFNQTKYSNLTKLLSVKQLDDLVVELIETFLPDNSTIEEADSIMAGVKRLKEVRTVNIININFSNVAQLKQRLTAWMQIRVDVNSEDSDGLPWKAGELCLVIQSPELSKSERNDVTNHGLSLESKDCFCSLWFPDDKQYRIIIDRS